MHRVTQERTTTCLLALVWGTLFSNWPDCQLPLCDYFTAVTTNTHPQRVFFLVETCPLVDVIHWCSWFFLCWPREDSFLLSQALGRTCSHLSHSCNINAIGSVTLSCPEKKLPFREKFF